MIVNKKYLYVGGAALLALALSYAFGRYSAPVQIKEVEKIKIVEVEKKQQNEKKDVTTVIVKKPDGSTTTTTTDKTVIDTKTDTKTATTDDKSKTTTYKKPDWRVGAIAGLDIHSSSLTSVKPIYGAFVERRILGPIFIGGFGVSNGTFGISAGFEF